MIGWDTCQTRQHALKHASVLGTFSSNESALKHQTCDKFDDESYDLCRNCFRKVFFDWLFRPLVFWLYMIINTCITRMNKRFKQSGNFMCNTAQIFKNLSNTTFHKVCTFSPDYYSLSWAIFKGSLGTFSTKKPILVNVYCICKT